MPWCPKCRVEYREGFNMCPDCEQELVDELQLGEESSKGYGYKYDNDEEVFLVSVADEIEADIIESLLGSHGIPVMKKRKETGSYLNIVMGVNLFGVDIYVPSKAFKKANEILMARDEYESVLESQDKIGKREEEILNEENEYRIKRRRWFFWTIILLFLAPVIISVLYMFFRNIITSFL